MWQGEPHIDGEPGDLKFRIREMRYTLPFDQDQIAVV